MPATEPNLVPHGALVTGLSSTDTADFTPAYSMPAAGSADSSPPAIGDAAFPGTLQRVATYGTFTLTGTRNAAQLDLVAGQFLPDPLDTGRRHPAALQLDIGGRLSTTRPAVRSRATTPRPRSTPRKR